MMQIKFGLPTKSKIRTILKALVSTFSILKIFIRFVSEKVEIGSKFLIWMISEIRAQKINQSFEWSSFIDFPIMFRISPKVTAQILNSATALEGTEFNLKSKHMSICGELLVLIKFPTFTVNCQSQLFKNFGYWAIWRLKKGNFDILQCGFNVKIGIGTRIKMISCFLGHQLFSCERLSELLNSQSI